MSKLYSEAEDQTLRENYGKMPYRQLETLFVNRNRDSLRHRARKLNLPSPGVSYLVSIGRQQYEHNDKFFDNPTRLSSYWAGFIAADGCIPFNTKHFAIYLSVQDQPHLEQLKCDLGANDPITLRPKHSNGMCRLALWNALGIRFGLERNFNIGPRKSLTLMPPVNLSPENQLAFAIGYVDGDGSIQTTKQGYIRLYIIGTQSFLTWLAHLFSQFTTDLDATSHYPKASVKPSKHMRNFTYTVTGRRAAAILSGLKAISSDLPVLQRKWQIVQ